MNKELFEKRNPGQTGTPGTVVGAVVFAFIVMIPVSGCTGESARNGVEEAQARETGEAYAETVSANLEPAVADGSLQAPTAAGASQSLDQSRSTALVRAAERVAPAVVSVSVIRRQQVRARSMWDMFMGPSARLTSGFGSGVLIRPAGHTEGFVLTNEHVIRGARQVLVTLPDGREFEPELVGADGLTDVAVLRLPEEDLPYAPLGTSRGLLIGEWAMAIGNPFAYLLSNSEPTVTAGVVSATGRNIIPSGQEDRGFYLGMIQTDASINPGNSGGPLVNSLGEVIGVNTSIFSRSGGSEGLGFAIPIDRAIGVAEDLIQFGEVRRAWTGMDVEAAEADDWGRTRGVRVSSVAPGSPADEAGLDVGDRLLEANGRNLGSPLDFQAVLLDAKAGDGVDVIVEGRRRTVTLVAESLPTSRAERVEILRDLEVITVTPEVRAERGIRSEAGALITGIPAPMARSRSLARGDVILRINNTPITSAESAAAALRALPSGVRVVLYLERDGHLRIGEFVTQR